MTPRLVPHDPSWEAAFAEMAAAVRPALGTALSKIHHIGSTAVPGLTAKPILDMLGEATSLQAIDAAAANLTALGFEAKGEFGIPGRRYFRRTHEGRRTHHLHVFEHGAPEIERHLALRDYLRRHPAKSAAYAAFKASLADLNDSAYQDRKVPFVADMTEQALDWYRRHRL